jgi:cobalt-zinc-cadmium efflux system protein
LYLIWVGYDLLIKSTKILMLFTPKEVNIKDVVRSVNKIPKINRLHHVHIWSLNDDELHLEAHLEFKVDVTITEFNTILQEVELILHKDFNINHITIQPEFNKQDPKEIIVQD